MKSTYERDVVALLANVEYDLQQGELPTSVSGICVDSRTVQAGEVFVAIVGTESDGHNFVCDAERAGASLIVVERSVEFSYETAVAVIKVRNTSQVLCRLAHGYYRNPSASMRVVGVTGTNGKTTVATLLYELVQGLGNKAGLISTVEIRIGAEKFPSSCTTPGVLEMCRILASMREAQCEYVFLEVSSHAMVQQRVCGVHFSGGVFTNLTQDHLDYHESMVAYRDAKKLFFDMLPDTSFALYNAKDPNGEYMVQNCGARVYSYSAEGGADYCGRMLEEGVPSSLIRIDGRDLFVKFAGQYNVYNLVAVYAVAHLLDLCSESRFFEVFSSLTPVRGRFECVEGPQKRLGIVDYAHTPDALLKVIEAARNVVRPFGGNLLVVFGAGGDRDRRKRKEMGAASVRGTRWVILTSDNPRTESPEQIISEISEGIKSEHHSKVFRIVDRREAIRHACMLSEPGDCILVAGKGHETYQEIEGVRNHFDDKEELEKSFTFLE